jgi:GDPmannose 4,6-dehydratase
MTTGSSRRVALIAGITGQDGAYLARFLLGKGYVVHGTSRDAALARLDGLIALGICDKVGTRAANEQTAFRPKSPYGIAKAAAISLVANYRESYGLFACSGLLFNHESPLRPSRFVTRKITAAAARIGAGCRARLALGNLSIRRDWGWAPEYVEAMWRMLQCDQPDDFVVASGVVHSLEEFAAAAFREVGLDWRDHVDYDPSLVRSSEIMYSLGDPTKAAQMLQWHPTVKMPEIVARMVRAEQEAADTA